METGSWVGFGIPLSIAAILLVLLIARTIHRARRYRDCCGSCRIRLPGGHSRRQERAAEGVPPGIAGELQTINDRQRAEQGTNGRSSLGRSNSQTFDPLNPDSLELPVHGVRYPDPGEGEGDAPPGGHNDDFRVVFGGVDEPDKTGSGRLDTPTSGCGESRHLQADEGAPHETEGRAETEPSGDVTTAEEREGSQETPTAGRPPDPASSGQEDAPPTKEDRLDPTEDTNMAHDKSPFHPRLNKFERRETQDETTYADNPVAVDDSELRPVYV